MFFSVLYVSVFGVFYAGGNGADVACYLHLFKHIMHNLSFEPLFVYECERETKREFVEWERMGDG